MSDNICETCTGYEKCGHPDRYMKCLAYEEKEEQNEDRLGAVQHRSGSSEVADR